MSLKISLLSILAGAFVVSAAVLPIGCTVATDPYQQVVIDQYEADPADATTNNNSFTRASRIDLSSDSAAISAVLTYQDVDVYNLGDFAAGDSMTVDVNIPDRVLLNAAVAIFDAAGRLFYLNGEYTQIANQDVTDVKFPEFAPHFDFTVRQATSPLYLALASVPEADVYDPTKSEGLTGGPYTVQIAVTRGGPAPQPMPQVVALQFDDSVVDYPPSSYFGQISNMAPMSLSGLDGRVLDPAWWRAFVNFNNVLSIYQNNAQFWANFLTFATTAQLVPQAQQQMTAAQIMAQMGNELSNAAALATSSPYAYTPTNMQWFQANGFNWLYAMYLYLGPGSGQTAGMVPPIWDTSVLISNPAFPTVQDPKYYDVNKVVDAIRTKLEEIYSGLNIEFLAVGQDDIPTDVPVTTLYLVSNSVGGSGLFGLASNIDIGNADRSDFAVVFAGEIGLINALQAGAYNPNTSSSQIHWLQTSTDAFNYVGATAGHELGHTLGLVHTNQSNDLMDRFADLSNELTATLNTAPLDESMFPIGKQDSYLLLLQELGMAP